MVWYSGYTFDSHPRRPRFDSQFIIIITVFCPRAGPSLLVQEPRSQFCRSQVFHRKLRNQGWSFTSDWIGAVVSRCFPQTTLSLASEQTLKDLKISQGTNVGVRRVDLANWALRTSPKFTTCVKYQFHQSFWTDQRSGNPNHTSPTIPVYTRRSFREVYGLQGSIQLRGVNCVPIWYEK